MCLITLVSFLVKGIQKGNKDKSGWLQVAKVCKSHPAVFISDKS